MHGSSFLFLFSLTSLRLIYFFDNDTMFILYMLHHKESDNYYKHAIEGILYSTTHNKIFGKK